MSVGQQEQSSFYSIYEGKICRSFKTPTKNSKTRTNKNGKVVHEEFYDYIDGMIVGIKTKEHPDYGKSWQIELLDGDVMQTLQLQYSSGYSQAFLKMLPNVDFDEKVKIIPQQKLEGDKKKTTIYITQGGYAVKWAFTKDDPNGLPPLAKLRIKGKDTWDDSAQMDFLEEMVKNDIVPNLPNRAGKSSPDNSEAYSTHEAAAPSDNTELIKDLPF